eukprot:TRINITY_DN3684_c0_g1_i2.p1 TRINITY_DN3684_c0_g1~~TRINITY_DN3684_c0_g1_i2.p1  ORF type:complete len:179 (+),score=26.45 TRINITY_DN3684_c0_g1_i2:2-538(+)
MEINKTPDILARLKKIQHKYSDMITNIYIIGSRVYGTSTPSSDWDYVALIDAPMTTQHQVHDGIQLEFDMFEDELMDITFIPIQRFQQLLQEHRQQALQVIFLPHQYRIVELYPISFSLDPAMLFRTIQWESKRRMSRVSHTLKRKGFVKAKKEIIHSIRYVLFAIQIMKYVCLLVII